MTSMRFLLVHNEINSLNYFTSKQITEQILDQLRECYGSTAGAETVK